MLICIFCLSSVYVLWICLWGWSVYYHTVEVGCVFCETSDLVGYLAFQDYISFHACVNHGTDLASFKCDVGKIWFFFFLLCVCVSFTVVAPMTVNVEISLWCVRYIKEKWFFLLQMLHNLPHARHVSPRSHFGSPQPKHHLLDVVSGCWNCLIFRWLCKEYFPPFLPILFIETSWLSRSDYKSKTWISLRTFVSAVASLSASNFLTASSVASILRAWVMRASSSCSLSRPFSLMLLIEVPIIIWSRISFVYFLFFCTVGVSTFEGAFVSMLSYLINKGDDFLSGLLAEAMKLVME